MIKNNAGRILVILIVFSVLSSIGLQFLQNNSVKIKQVSGIQEIYDLEEGYLFFGRPSCPACQRFKPILKLISKERRIEFNYVNSDYLRDEKRIPEEDLRQVINKYNIDSIPYLAYVKNGKLCRFLESDILGKKDKSLVYREVNNMLDDVEKGSVIRFEYLSILLLFSCILIFQIMSYKCNKITKRLNYLLILPLLTSCSLFSYWYMQFSNNNLNLFKDNKMLWIISLAIIIFIMTCFLQNRDRIKRNSLS